MSVGGVKSGPDRAQKLEAPEAKKATEKTPEAPKPSEPTPTTTPSPTRTLRTPEAETRAREEREQRRRDESTLATQRTRLDESLSPTTLRTERVGDGDESCLEKAAAGARPGRDELVFLDDQRTAAEGDTNDAGHVLVRDRASGRVWDPNDGTPPQNTKAWPYRSTEDWISRQGTTSDGRPAYAVDATVRAERVQEVLALPPEERAAHIEASGDPALAKIADRRYADGEPNATGPTSPVRLTDAIPAEERPDFTRVDAWAEQHRQDFRPDEVRDVLAGRSDLGALTDAERTRVMDHVTDRWRGSSEVYRDPPTDHSAIGALARGVSTDPELSRFVANDYAQRAATLVERNAGQGQIPNPRVTAQAASFASGAGTALQQRADGDRRALLDSLGDRAPAFAQALALHDDRLNDGGSARYGSVPRADYRASMAGRFLEAAGSGEPSDGTRAFVSSAFASMTDRTLQMSPDLPRQTANALANQWHHGDPATRQREAARFTGILETRQGREFLFGGQHTLAARADNVALMRAHPEWNADTLRSHDSAWENPTIMSARAQPRARDFLANRGDDPVALGGSDLDNTVGYAMGFPPQGIPANETPAERDAREAAVARGEHSYYTGEPAGAVVGPVADQIRRVGGDNPEVTVLPVQYASDGTGAVDLPLFRVRDRETGADRYVDNLGRRYDSFEDWRTNNQLPPGNMTYPTGGHLRAGADGDVLLQSGNTPNTIDTWGERLGQVVDGAALVGGVVATGVIIAGSGGTATPFVVAGAASAWGALRAGDSLIDRAQHGQSLDPINDAGARSDWLAFGANALGVAGLGATAAASRFARGGSTFAPAAATAASYLNVTGAAVDGLAAADAGYTLATRWDQLSGAERAQLGLSMGFWGLSTARGALQSGGRVTDMFDPNVQRQRILESDPILRGTTDANAQGQRLGGADPDLVAQVRARARGLEGDTATRFNADLERALLEAPPGTTNDVLRLYRDLDPAAARRSYDAIQGLATPQARQAAFRSVSDGADYIQRTITDPAERAAMVEGLARIAGNPRINGVDDWVRFSTQARTGVDPAAQAQNFRDDFGELLVAENMARTLGPGETVRVGADARAQMRPGTNDPLPSYDLVVEGGARPRNIDVYSPAGRADVNDLGRAINHAADKIVNDPALPANLHTQGTVEGAVRLDWPPGVRRTGAGDIVTAADGTITLQTGNGQTIARGNYFQDYVATLNDPRRAPAGASRVDALTVYGRDGTPLFHYARDPASGLWTGRAP